MYEGQRSRDLMLISVVTTIFISQCKISHWIVASEVVLV